MIRGDAAPQSGKSCPLPPPPPPPPFSLLVPEGRGSILPIRPEEYLLYYFFLSSSHRLSQGPQPRLVPFNAPFWVGWSFRTDVVVSSCPFGDDHSPFRPSPPLSPYGPSLSWWCCMLSSPVHTQLQLGLDPPCPLRREGREGGRSLRTESWRRRGSVASIDGSTQQPAGGVGWLRVGKHV